MIRLNETREQKHRKRLIGMSSLSNITHFGDITGLTGGEPEVSWTGIILHV